jgi:hypothetical protein
MDLPSGLQAGELTIRKVSEETARLLPPSKSIIQIFSPPPSSEVYTIWLPSGLKDGCICQAKSEVKGVPMPPVAGIE